MKNRVPPSFLLKTEYAAVWPPHFHSPDPTSELLNRVPLVGVTLLNFTSHR